MECKKNEFGYSSLEHKGLLGFGGEMQKYANSTYLFSTQHRVFKPSELNVNTWNIIRTIEELNQRLFNLYGEIIFKDAF